MWGRVALIVVASGVIGSLIGGMTHAKPFLPIPTPTVGPMAVHHVSLNTATIKELRTLPGVGELLAQRIVAGRPYHAVSDLHRVKGITPKRFKAIERQVSL